MSDKNGKQCLPLPCVFSDDVLCAFRKSENLEIMNRCSWCEHYKRFAEEMERDEEEFWDRIDEINENSPCLCDGGLCSNKPVGSCYGIAAHSGKLIVCPRFDVNRVPDRSMIKTEFLRLRRGGPVGR